MHQFGTAAGAGTAGRWLAAAAAGLLAAQGSPGLTALGPLRRAAFPRLSGAGPADHVALTFDDGPDPGFTPRFLELLAARRVRATFFLLGSMVAQTPRLAARIAADGHEIGVHGWDHRCLLLRSPRATFADLRRATEIIASATGSRPRLFRPPYGVLSGAGLAAALRLRLTTVLWTCWGREWAPASTPGSVYGTLAGRLAGGATVLLHDSDCTSPAGSARAALGATAMLLDECARRGLRAGPLGEHRLEPGPGPRSAGRGLRACACGCRPPCPPGR